MNARAQGTLIRNAIMRARVEAGESLRTIALDYGITRQRVHQIVARNA